jgi:hypothetical protein
MAIRIPAAPVVPPTAPLTPVRRVTAREDEPPPDPRRRKRHTDPPPEANDDATPPSTDHIDEYA